MHMFVTALLLSGCSWVWPEAAQPPPSEDAEPKQRGGHAKRGKLMPTDPFVAQDEPCGPWKNPGPYLYDFVYEGKHTEVSLFIGKSGPKRDLVFLLHGGSGGAASIVKKSQFHQKARKEGFVAVVPEAHALESIGTRWNTGKFEGQAEERLRPGESLRDDVDYLDQLAKALRTDLCASSVTAVGFSSGGQMTHTWACKGNEVDAIMSAAGALLVGDNTCPRQVPVLGLVGTRDDVYTHGPDKNDPTQPSAPESVRMWAKTNGCSKEAPEESQVGDATCYTFQGCAAQTQLCVIEGLPHAYPDGKQSSFDATEYGWSWMRSLGR